MEEIVQWRTSYVLVFTECY